MLCCQTAYTRVIEGDAAFQLEDDENKDHTLLLFKVVNLRDSVAWTKNCRVAESHQEQLRGGSRWWG